MCLFIYSVFFVILGDPTQTLPKVENFKGGENPVGLRIPELLPRGNSKKRLFKLAWPLVGNEGMESYMFMMGIQSLIPY